MRGHMRIAGAVLAAGCVPPATSAIVTAAQAATTTGTCASAQIVLLDDLAFQPQAVSPGQMSRATLSAVNCTAQPQQTAAEWLGRFVGSSPGIPPGCPAYDPLVLAMNFPAHGRLDGSVGYLVPGPCTAAGLVVTVKILQNGTVVAQRSAQLAIEQPSTGPAGSS